MRRMPFFFSLFMTGVLVMGLSATPATAARSDRFVALGDSYSSGVGSRDYYADGTRCHRSPEAYSSLIAADYSLDLTLVACSGATTRDVLRHQLRRLTRGTGYVTITVGGNDIGFTSVLTECAKPAWLGSCSDAIEVATSTMTGELPDRLSKVLARIKRRAPRARVVVAGYPHLFNGEDCNAGTFFSPIEEARLNRATDQLDALIKRDVLKARMHFVSPVASFDGHAVCDRTEWVNGLSYPIFNSFHPIQTATRTTLR